jgi:ABC-type sugar transport system permease subunit
MKLFIHSNRSLRIIIYVTICVLIPILLSLILGTELYPHNLFETLIFFSGISLTFLTSFFLLWELLVLSKELNYTLQKLSKFSNTKIRR